MKLVGDACLESHLSVPVIGIAPYGATNGNDKLAGQFRRVVYTNVPSPSKDGAPLNGGHTHFLLVDSGLAGRGAWGTEIKLRSRLENFYVERKGVPRVVLVVNGGPGTMETVLEATRAPSPIVVIADSGGAASAISRYCSISRDSISRDARRTHGEAMAGLAKDFPAFANDRMADKLLELSQLNDDCGGKLVTLFRLKQGDFSGSAAGCDMSTSLLEAITKLWLSSPADDALSAEPSLLRRATEARSSDGSEPSSSRGHPHSLGNSRNNSWTNMDQFNPNRMRSRRKRAILLAVRWDRPDILERILQQQRETAGESCWSEAHTAALQFALSLHKPGVIKHLLEASQQTISLKDVTSWISTATSTGSATSPRSPRCRRSSSARSPRPRPPGLPSRARRRARGRTTRTRSRSRRGWGPPSPSSCSATRTCPASPRTRSSFTGRSSPATGRWHASFGAAARTRLGRRSSGRTSAAAWWRTACRRRRRYASTPPSSRRWPSASSTPPRRRRRRRRCSRTRTARCRSSTSRSSSR